MSLINDNSQKPQMFHTTAWTVVHKAGDQHETERRKALEFLIQAYWKPLYLFAIHRHLPPQDAEDQVQAFFANLLEKNALRLVDKNRGKFRTFLLTAFNNFQTSEWRKQNSLKRGGQKQTISMNIKDIDDREMEFESNDLSPEEMYDKNWALTILQRSLKQFKDECHKVNKMERYELLQQTLGNRIHSIEELAGQFNLSISNTKSLIYRAKRRLKSIMEKEVSELVSDPSLVENELQTLGNALF